MDKENMTESITLCLADVTEEQRKYKYRCLNCGWIGTIDQMEGDTDCDDEYDAVWGDFCCPNFGCWMWHFLLEDWERVE